VAPAKIRDHGTDNGVLHIHPSGSPNCGCCVRFSIVTGVEFPSLGTWDTAVTLENAFFLVTNTQMVRSSQHSHGVDNSTHHGLAQPDVNDVVRTNSGGTWTPGYSVILTLTSYG
jgi:hypothetical protein